MYKRLFLLFLLLLLAFVSLCIETIKRIGLSLVTRIESKNKSKGVNCFVNFTCKQPLALLHLSIEMKTVSMSGNRQPFLYQYLKLPGDSTYDDALYTDDCQQYSLEIYQ